MDYTLLADGPSDIVLMGPIGWLLKRHGISEFNGRFADPFALPKLSEGLTERAVAAIAEYPCQVLFVHRDAEGIPFKDRWQEIDHALQSIGKAPSKVFVVPVRMTEAWFLFDEQAIRRASNNPNGKESLELPGTAQFETVLSPKDKLSEAIKLGSGLTGRRLDHFQRGLAQARRRVADYITDYTPLLSLPSFSALDNEIKHLADQVENKRT